MTILAEQEVIAFNSCIFFCYWWAGPAGPFGACFARHGGLRPDDVGRWTTRKPIDAAPRAQFKSTRTLPQRAMPTTFGTPPADSDSYRAPPGDPRRAPLSLSVGWKGNSRPATIGGGPGRYCRQLDSDTASVDALAHRLGLAVTGLHWTGLLPKPRSCNGSREKAKRRRPGRRAGSPVRPKTHGLPRRGCPY
jgi:hypothetical protein